MQHLKDLMVWAWVSTLSCRQSEGTANASIAQIPDLYLAMLCKVSCSKKEIGMWEGDREAIS